MVIMIFDKPLKALKVVHCVVSISALKSLAPCEEQKLGGNRTQDSGSHGSTLSCVFLCDISD